MNNRINRPFLLSPVGKDNPWGGNRLKSEFAKKIDMTPLAESWECSTHPNGISTVASGDFSGMLLSELLERYPQLLGTRYSAKPTLPIMVKFIDAAKNLSLQVHPDDDYAAEHENGQNGKTECWYVVDAEPGATLLFGLSSDIDIETFKAGVVDGSIEKYLQKVEVHKGDCFLIPPGVIHAIGAGMIIAEIQESSDLTYRIYDYNRTDKNGNKRPLHIEKAVEIAKLTASPVPCQPAQNFTEVNGGKEALLRECKYFRVDRLLINADNDGVGFTLATDSESFGVLLCIDGGGEIAFDGECIKYSKGDCIFLPADSPEIAITGSSEILKIVC